MRGLTGPGLEKDEVLMTEGLFHFDMTDNKWEKGILMPRRRKSTPSHDSYGKFLVVTMYQR